MTPRIIPVLDLLDGQIVRGFRGLRATYQPIQSRLVSGSDPLQVARQLAEFGVRDLYLADLNALRGEAMAVSLFQALKSIADWRICVDAGIQHPESLSTLLSIIDFPILALETIADREQLHQLIKGVDTQRLVFSVDMHGGIPLRPWKGGDLYQDLHHLGIRRVILLDLDRVGTGTGVGTREQCQELRKRYPDWEITLGGGISGVEELVECAESGADAVLIASALHDGRIPPTYFTS